VKEAHTRRWATTIQFSCDRANHQKNSHLKPHVFTLSPETVSENESRGENDAHSSYAINHLIVVAFHQMGVGPYHAQMLAGMIGHPWKQMHYCFQKT
jgi:hypothetical protein